MTTPAQTATRRATMIGSIAVLLWATLALFTSSTGAVPPFQLMAMTFAIAFLFAALKWMRDASLQGRSAFAFLRQPWPVWAIGIGGLFLYHLFYFVALDHAPAVEASLIAYLWPLLIVLFSALLPGEKLYWQHVVGALIGMGGAVAATEADPACRASPTGHCPQAEAQRGTKRQVPRPLS